MDYQQEPREFFGGSMIKMPMADFVKEHNDLIHILRYGSPKERAAEAASQEKELKSKRGSGNVCMRGIAGVDMDDIEDARRQQAINSARELARARANPGRVFPLSEAMETPAWISPAPLSDYPPWGIYHQEQNPRPPRSRRKSRRSSDPKRGRGIASSKRSAKVAPITEEEEDRGIGVGDVTLLTLKEKVDAAKKAFRAKQAAEKAANKKPKRGHLRKLFKHFF
jgi:hypothetical protein